MKCVLKLLAHWVVMFIAVPSAMAAQNLPPPVPHVANAPSTIASAPATALMLGDVSISLEQTTLASIVQRFGLGRVQKVRDAGDRMAWLCYSLPQGLRLWLVSGELGGEDGYITTWHVRAGRGKADPSCPELTVGVRLAVPKSRSIWIGTTASHLKIILEKPSAVDGGWRVYSFTGPAAKEGFEQLTLFGAHLRSGRVDELFASQATTN